MRSQPAIIGDTLYPGDHAGMLYALDPETLDTVWQSSARVFDTSVVTGSISFHDDRLYVPVSSYEVAVAGSPGYSCCRSHGAVLALDASSGKQLWAWHATADAVLQGQNADGVDMDSGEPAWIFQATADDVWNAACQNEGANCPEWPGPDLDFGASVIIADVPGGGQVVADGWPTG